MDGGKTVQVELSGREVYAVLAALVVSRALAKGSPEAWEARVRAAAEALQPECFAGVRQWQADEVVAGLKLWRAAGLPGEPLV